MKKLLRLLPLIVLLAAWEALSRASDRLHFVASSPSGISAALNRTDFHQLSGDFLVTLTEVIAGYALGTFIGTCVGLLLWLYPRIAWVARPYVAAFGAIPFFALAPLMIVWFGVGIEGKIAMAVLTTVGVATVQAYEGARDTQSDHMFLLRSLGASRRQIFAKLIVPGSLTWVIAGYKLNVGFAILGAVIGEFIASERGLGHMVIRAGSLYDVGQVWIGIIGIVVIALGTTALIGVVERRMLAWRTIGAPKDDPWSQINSPSLGNRSGVGAPSVL